MNKQAKSPLLQRSGVSTVFSSLLCIVIGLALGFLFLVALDPSGAWEGGFLRILKGGFYMWPIGVGREIAQIAPLIMTGPLALPSKPACSILALPVSIPWVPLARCSLRLC